MKSYGSAALSIAAVFGAADALSDALRVDIVRYSAYSWYSFPGNISRPFSSTPFRYSYTAKVTA